MTKNSHRRSQTAATDAQSPNSLPSVLSAPSAVPKPDRKRVLVGIGGGVALR